MFFRRSQHPGEADLSAYADGEVTPARGRQIRAHVETCDACRELLNGLQETRALVAGLPRAETARSFRLSPAMAGTPREPARPRVLSFAPAVTLSLLVALLLVDLGSNASVNTSSDESSHNRPASKASGDATTSESAPQAALQTLPTQPAAAAANDSARQSGPTANAASGAAPSTAAPPPSVFAAPFAPTPAPGATQPQAATQPPSASGPAPSILAVPPGATPLAGATLPQAAAAQPSSTASGSTAPSLGSGAGALTLPPSSVPAVGATAQGTAVAPPVASRAASAEAGQATPQAALAPQPAIVPPAAPGPGTASQAASQPGTSSQVTPQAGAAPQVVPPPGAISGAPPAIQGADRDATKDGGRSLLRLLEVAALAAFVASLVAFAWPRLVHRGDIR